VLHSRIRATAVAPRQGAEGPFRIDPDLDVEAIGRTYREQGRVRIYGLLAEGAVDLLDHFRARTDWIHLIYAGDGVLELEPADRARLSPDRWAEIEAAAHARAREGEFEYRYEALRVPDEDEKSGDLLSDFADFMQSRAMLDLLRAVTGHDEISFTDGQATAYGPGDFLTGHDDDVEGKNRLAAYVFGLTPGWRVEWGGLLLFHGEHDRTVAGLAPRFNTLDLFRVPQRHSVSEVTRAAPHRRYAVTGWLRSGVR
jgi:SM-20-related protein